MSEEPVKTKKEWLEELGLEDLRIQVDASMSLHMQPMGCKNYVSNDFVKPYRFFLRGLKEGSKRNKSDESGWTLLAYLSTVRFCRGRARDLGVEDLGMYTRPYYRSIAVDVGAVVTEYDSLFFEDLCIESEYKGLGLAKHLFDRALEFHDPSSLGCVLAPSGRFQLPGTTDGGRALSTITDTWAHFEPVAETGNARGVKAALIGQFLERGEPKGLTRYDVLAGADQGLSDIASDLGELCGS